MKTTQDNLEKLIDLLKDAKAEDGQQILGKTLPHFAAILAILHSELRRTNKWLAWLTVVVLAFVLIILALIIWYLCAFAVTAGGG